MDDLSSRLHRAAAEPTRPPDVRGPYRRVRRARVFGSAGAAVVTLLLVSTLVVATGGASHRVRVVSDAPASSSGRRPTGVASWPVYSDGRRKISISIAPGWYRSDQPLEPWLVSPGEILSLATTHLTAAGHHEACRFGTPQTAIDNIGPDGVYLWLGEWRPRAADYGTTPNARPAHFAQAAWVSGCALPNGMTARAYTFTDGSRDFTVTFVRGSRASADRIAQLYEMLDGLHFGA